MKIIKAYLLGFFHLMKYLILLNTDHCGYVEYYPIKFLGFNIVIKIKTIGCICGKIFYNEDDK